MTLLEHAKTLEISTRQKAWPKAPHVLVRQLNELAPSLKSLGWEVVTSKSGGARRISINSVPSVPSGTLKEQKGDERDGRDAKDAIITSSFGSLGERLEESPVCNIDNVIGWLCSEFQKGINQVLRVEPLNPVDRGRCPLCNRPDQNLPWQVQFLDGSRVDACCVDCGGRIQEMVREFGDGLRNE